MIEEILAAREKTHGRFDHNSDISQAIKRAMRETIPHLWDRLDNKHKEGLELIATKISRKISGDPEHPDHSDDCEGYLARLNEGPR